MTLAAKIYLVASILYPGESVVEEAARVEVIPATMTECAKQLRLAGNMLRPGPLQVVLTCIDDSIMTGGGVSDRAGLSLEKEKPGKAAGKRKGWGKSKR